MARQGDAQALREEHARSEEVFASHLVDPVEKPAGGEQGIHHLHAHLPADQQVERDEDADEERCRLCRCLCFSFFSFRSFFSRFSFLLFSPSSPSFSDLSFLSFLSFFSFFPSLSLW
jgi:hypothetical protein